MSDRAETTLVRFRERCTYEGDGEVYSVPAGAVGEVVEREVFLGEPIWTVRLGDGRHVSVLPAEVEATDAG